MTLEEALDDAMRKYLNGENNKAFTKYSLDYFDDAQEKIRNPSRVDSLKKKMKE